MGRIIKNTFLTISVLLILNFCVANENKVPIKFFNEEKELTDIYVQRLFEGQKDDASEQDFEYICNTAQKISNFLNSLNKIEVVDYNYLVGNYKLMDSKNNYINDSKKFFLDNYISILSIDKKDLYFQSQSSTTEIYQDSKGALFFRSKWIEAIRQLKFIDGKMYVYILDGDYWYLDSIHENGKYFYKKIDENVDSKIIDFKEWFDNF